ncbi:MAG: glutamine amidotransferase, partial [Actinobacteria bacterium]|nr:glutamine amidotransferase [Actinomycetota bacterium]
MFYKNSIGTYLHGPILPKNPHLADYLIKVALEKKYKKTIELSSLDDSLEWRAHKAIAMKLGIEI